MTEKPVDRKLRDESGGAFSHNSVAFMLVALVAVSFAADRAEAQSEASSIREFVAAQDKWARLVGQPLKLEGRYSVLSSRDMLFAGCDVRFLIPKNVLRPLGDSRNIEVSGRLEKRDRDYVFVVDRMRSRPSDLDYLEQQRTTIDTRRPDALYKLARWARERGKFYEDEDLRQAADRLFQSGLSREFESLEDDDVAGRRTLATKAAEFGSSLRLQREYLHDADRTAFELEREKAEPVLKSVLHNLEKDLPGANEPLPADEESLRKDYEKAPRAVYRIADDATRRLLERIFYGEIVLAEIERNAAEDGSNGRQIAAQIEKRLPERTGLAEEYRQRELDYLDQHAPQLTRERLLELAGRFESRGETDKATDAKQRWLKSRERIAKQDGPRGLMELGEEYLSLLQDNRGAARMFQLAYQENPQLATASTWLSEHGYELHDGAWRLPGEAGQQAGRIADAIHEGRLLEGMTGAQVRSTLGGAPTMIVRMASAGRISEIWLYQELHISVQLNRRSHEDELSVLRFTVAP